MKQGANKKKIKSESKYATVKISRSSLDKVKENKDKTRVPILVFIETAIDEKLSRQ